MVLNLRCGSRTRSERNMTSSSYSADVRLEVNPQAKSSSRFKVDSKIGVSSENSVKCQVAIFVHWGERS
jgi:hypothetical protein